LDTITPNLVQILDGGECADTGALYVAMQFVQGIPLDKAIGGLPRPLIAPLIRQIASAARYLDNRGYCHRDIKPSNVMLSSDYSVATLLDLGVIRPYGGSSLTDPGEFLGTHQYGPPEFIFRTEDGSQDSLRAITYYQLGGVLHDLIMRRPLFEAYVAPRARLVDAVKHEIPVVDAPDVPPGLLVLAANCLAKDAVQRLKWVDWNAFDVDFSQPPSVMAIKERIRRREAGAAISSVAIARLEEEQRRRTERRVVNDINGRLCEILRAECVSDSGSFPPIELHEIEGEDSTLASAILVLSRSEARCLRRTLSLIFKVTLLDAPSSAFRLDTVAAVADSPLVLSDFDASPPKTLREGVDQVDHLREVVIDFLYAVFDRAQIETGLESGPVWLHLGGETNG